MDRLKRKKYEKLIEPMQAELVAMARWIAATGQRVVILFEGRDTAGKGGAIQAVARSTRASAGWLHSVRRAKRRLANGISSASASTCRARVRSRCLTAAGTTARALRK